jgi:hypothetical protein
MAIDFRMQDFDYLSESRTFISVVTFVTCVKLFHVFRERVSALSQLPPDTCDEICWCLCVLIFEVAIYAGYAHLVFASILVFKMLGNDGSEGANWSELPNQCKEWTVIHEDSFSGARYKRPDLALYLDLEW